MHTRSAKNKETGLLTVTVWDWNGAVFFQGEFADLAEANAAAANQERLMTLKMQAGAAPLTMDEILMSDDELLAALTA